MKELLAEIKWTEVPDPLDINDGWKYFSEKLISYYKVVSPYSLGIQDTRKNIFMT